MRITSTSHYQFKMKLAIQSGNYNHDDVIIWHKSLEHIHQDLNLVKQLPALKTKIGSRKIKQLEKIYNKFLSKYIKQ